ncbi:hypothetical protein LOY49_10835 [Pseudomonas atacamensis]|jgi:hypothetical protein|nr:hypothetical protein [Pseudomonas atacamensis]UVK95798.1 hypothetical protein LOY49_10835 [Pseudomonas atacamensis]
MRTYKNLSFPSSLGVAPGLQFLLGCAIFAGGTLILMSELARTFFAM